MIPILVKDHNLSSIWKYITGSMVGPRLGNGSTFHLQTTTTSSIQKKNYNLIKGLGSSSVV